MMSEEELEPLKNYQSVKPSEPYFEAVVNINGEIEPSIYSEK